MAWLKPINIIARDLDSAFFQTIEAIIEHGRQWTVERGSYEGQKRWELDYLQLHITHPHDGPLVPTMPPHLSHLPPPTTEEYVYEYLPYMMEDLQLKENEQYSYGQRIAPQMQKIIERYKKGYGSNQECITVAQPKDIELPDPPCMRSLDCRIFPRDVLKVGEPQALHFFVYFRSWDAESGLPANLAAITLMQKYMADAIGVVPGEIIANSKGCHVYQYAADIAKLRVGNR